MKQAIVELKVLLGNYENNHEIAVQNNNKEQAAEYEPKIKEIKMGIKHLEVHMKETEGPQTTQPARVVEIGTKRLTEVICLDSPGAGGACHKYAVRSSIQTLGVKIPTYAEVNFQNGPVKEAGPNGCFQEDLMVICIDRLQHFQKGSFACRDNAVALTKLEESLMWLNKRTRDRVARGVEGQNKQ